MGRFVTGAFSRWLIPTCVVVCGLASALPQSGFRSSTTGALVLKSSEAFSSLDGGPFDVDGTTNGVLTLESLTIEKNGRLVLDVDEATIEVTRNVEIRSNGAIGPTAGLRVPQDRGPTLELRAGGAIILRELARISADGRISGGNVTVCAGLGLQLHGSAAVSATGGRYAGSTGGTIELRTRDLILLTEESSIETSGRIGGHILLVSCSMAQHAIKVLGSLNANGSGGPGGRIDVEARLGGVSFFQYAGKTTATGTTGNGTINVKVATAVFPAAPPTLPPAAVQLTGPNRDPCDCIDLDLIATSPTSGPAPLSVTFLAQTNAEVAAYAWDFDGNSLVDFTSPNSPQASHTYGAPGVYQASVVIQTTNGFTASDSITVNVQSGLVATLMAFPESGTRPLTVRFTPGSQTTGPGVTGYRMDYQGDGIYDTGFLPRPDSFTFTYNSAGNFNATLQIRDEGGNLATASRPITVSNAAPTASVQLVPSNGPVPLSVLITVTASSPNGAITSVVIDPGDGTAPVNIGQAGSLNHVYQSAGSFTTVVTVTDAAAQSVTVSSPLVDVLVGPPGAPTAVANATPASGNSPLLVTFNANGSFDADGPLVLWEWDFEYDGNTFQADTSSTVNGNATHTYTGAGQHFAALRVTDSSALTSIDAVGVVVQVAVTLTISDDTINPYSGVAGAGTTPVRTTLSADTNVRVYVADLDTLQQVRTLFQGTRPAGTYNDLWDGRDGNGAIVRDGGYLAFIEYIVDGVPFRVPTSLDPGTFVFVSQSEVPTNGASLDPWNDQFWELTFNTTSAFSNAGASRISLRITPFSLVGGTIVRTILSNAVFGTGVYKSYWEGLTEAGTYVASTVGSGGDLLWSAQAHTLPNNAIVVEGGRPEITLPSAEPNIFDASLPTCFGAGGAAVRFTLSKEAVVTLRVFSMTSTILVRQITTDPLASGNHIVVWDGKSQSGEFVKEGPYRVELVAAAGPNVSYERNVLVFVAY